MGTVLKDADPFTSIKIIEYGLQVLQGKEHSQAVGASDEYSGCRNEIDR